VLALVSEDPGRDVAVPMFQRVVDLLDFHLVVAGPRRIAAQRGDSFQHCAAILPPSLIGFEFRQIGLREIAQPLGYLVRSAGVVVGDCRLRPSHGLLLTSFQLNESVPHRGARKRGLREETNPGWPPLARLRLCCPTSSEAAIQSRATMRSGRPQSAREL
jgi:hypothetical protein